MPKAPPPLSSFGTELQSALRKGAETQYKINFPTEELAIRFVHRVNALRAAMRREKHPDWQNVYRAGLSIRGTVVTIGPKDSEFRSFLKDIVDDVPPSPPEKEVVVAPSAPGTVDDFLADIMGATTVPKSADNDTSSGDDPPDEEPPISSL